MPTSERVATPGWRTGRQLALRAGALTLTVSALGGAASWHASDVLLRPRAAPEQRLRILEAVPGLLDPDLRSRFGTGAGALVRLHGAERGAGTWGLSWTSGFGVVGSVDGADGQRPLLLLEGQLPSPDVPPVRATLRPACWPDAHDRGPVDALQHPVDGGVGVLACWRSTEMAETHVIMVHGRMARKSQLWRHVAALAPLGVSWTVASYRNGIEAPRTGLCELGAGEWADIEAVIDDAVLHGARRIVLLGMSMGGAIIATLLARTVHGERIAGVVLDSPVLDWSAVLRHVATGRRGLLRPLVPAVLALSAYRASLDVRGLQMLIDAERLAVPVLLLHGTEDRVVPVATSDALAAARPDLVTYERFDAAGHVTSWNAEPQRYDAALRAFVRQVA
jgi:uncharacterized protein